MDEKKKEIFNEALFITCRTCGCEYLEDKAWFNYDHKTSCPICGNILQIK